MMKPILFYSFAAIVVMAAVSACSQEFQYTVNPADELEVETTEVEFGPEAGSKSVAVFSGKNWEATPDSSLFWLTIEKNSDGMLLAAESNPDIFTRSGLIVITSGHRTFELQIIQKSMILEFAVKDTVKVSCDGGSVPVSVESNVSWNAVPDSSWVYLEGTTLLLTPNNSLVSRKTYMDFFHKGERIGRTLVIQEPVIPEITFSVDTIKHDSNAFIETISLNSNWPWKAFMSQVDSTWLEITTPQVDEDGLVVPGTGQSVTISGSSTKPSRDGTIVFISGESRFELHVSQEGVATVMSVDRKTFDVPSGQSSISFTIQSNNLWEIVCENEWLTFDKTAGNDGIIEVNATVAASDWKERTGIITVKSGDITENISVTQEGGPLKLEIICTKARDYFDGTFQASNSLAFNLGVNSYTWKKDPTMVFNIYSYGSFLINGTSGFRVNTWPDPAKYKTTNAIRKEELFYMSFPAIEGYRFTKLEIMPYNDSVSQYFTFLSTDVSESNENTSSHAITDKSFHLAKGVLGVLEPTSDTQGKEIYLVWLRDSGNKEGQMLSMTAYYTPVK